MASGHLRAVRGLVAASVGAVLVACGHPRAPRSVDAELGSIPAGTARVCIVRPGAVGANVTMEIRDNKRLVGATRGGTFACWLAASGEHQITSVDDDTGPTYLHARAGKHYWLHQDVMLLGGDLHAHLDWVDDVTATELLESCTRRVIVSVPGHDDRTDVVAVSPAL
jgi:hypothetical protein